MGRKRFLDTLAAAGVPTSLLPHITVRDIEEFMSDVATEVPIVYRWETKNRDDHLEAPYPKEAPSQSPVMAKIPTDYWFEIESAFDAARRIQRIINTIDSTGNIQASVKHNGFDRMVEVFHQTFVTNTGANGIVATDKPDASADKIRDVLPSKMLGRVQKDDQFLERMVDVDIAAETIQQPQCGENAVDEYAYELLPGGRQIKIQGANIGTSCTPAWNDELNAHVLLTAAHLGFDTTDESPSDALDRSAITPYNGDNGQLIGTVNDVYYESTICEFLSIDPTEGEVPVTYALADTDGGSLDGSINGTLDWSYIKSLGEENTPIIKQGQSGGRCEGVVTNTFSSGPCRFYSADSWSEFGDSGGPGYYHRREENQAVIAGLLSSGISPPANQGFFVYIGDIESELGVTVI